MPQARQIMTLRLGLRRCRSGRNEAYHSYMRGVGGHNPLGPMIGHWIQET